MKHVLPFLALALVLLGAAAPAQEAAPAPPASRLPAAAADADRPTRAFQVSLLRAGVAVPAGSEGSAGSEGPAGSERSAGSEGLSENVRKALEDLQDALPFGSYRLLDAVWLRTSVRASARLRGPEGQPWELTLHLAGRHSADASQIFISSFALRDLSGVNADPAAGPLQASRPLISTAFGLAEGETVVVGSTGLAGGGSLVVLLTAVPSTRAGG